MKEKVRGGRECEGWRGGEVTRDVEEEGWNEFAGNVIRSIP